MPGALLLDDWKQSVQDELNRHVQDALSQAQQAAASIPSISAPQIQAPQAPQIDPQAVLDQLNQHVQGLVAGATQAAQPAVVQVNQATQPATQSLNDVNDQLQQHVQGVIGGTFGGEAPVTATTPTPEAAPQTSNQGAVITTPPAAATVDVSGAPSSDTTTSSTQVVQPQTGGAAGSIPANYNVAVDKGPTISRDQAIAALKGTPLADIAGNIWDLGVKYNVDPAFALSIAKNESAYGDPNVAPGQAANNNVWDISNAAYGGTPNGTRWGQYPTKLAGAEAFYKLITQEYYPKGQTSVGSVMWGPNGNQQHAYAPTSENSTQYPQRLLDTMGGYRQLPGGDGGQLSVATAPTQQTTAQARAKDLGYNDISQFGDDQLTRAEAYAACGPAAAVRFAEKYGRNPTLREATDIAASVGWNSGSGMAGISSEKALMDKLGVPTKIVQGAQWDAFAKEAQTGNPVTISTSGKNGGHYFFADAYNSETGAFHVGQSGKDLIGGTEWMTPAQMENLMGSAQGALFADNPGTPVQSSAVQTTPTTTPAPAATPAKVTTVTQAQAPPVVRMGENQPATTPIAGGQSYQGPTPIQTAQDAVSGVVGDIQRAGQQAIATLGGAAEQARSAAGQAIGGAASAVGTTANQIGGELQQQGGAAGQALQSSGQDVAAAAQRVPPVLGGAASNLGSAASQTAQELGSSGAANALLRQGRTQQEEDEFAQQQQQQAAQIAQQAKTNPPVIGGPGDVARNVWDLVTNSSPGLPGVSLVDYQHASTVKNDWIQQNNPVYNLPGGRPGEGQTTPASVLGDLTTQIAQQITDPYSMTMFGLTAAWAARSSAVPLARRRPRRRPTSSAKQAPSSWARSWTSSFRAASPVACRTRCTSEAPGADPAAVGIAALQGAGFGGVMDLGLSAAKPLMRRIGQTIIDNAPQIRQAVSQLATSETGAVGAPSAVRAAGAPPQDVLHGQAVPRPGYEPGTPEHTTDQFLQDQARAQRTPTPQLSAADINGLPGMAGSRMRGLQEVRDAVEAGLPAARWYQEIVQQVKNDTGQDINPREAAVLMGAFGGNAGVAAELPRHVERFRRHASGEARPGRFREPDVGADYRRKKGIGCPVHCVQADQAYVDDDMLARVMRGYRTGDMPVPSGAKLSSLHPGLPARAERAILAVLDAGCVAGPTVRSPAGRAGR